MRTSSKFNIPQYEHLEAKVKEFVRQFTESLKRNHDDIYQDLKPDSIKLTVNSTTPSVKNGHLKCYYTANTAPTAITDFTDADEGQVIFVIGDANTSIADSGNFKLSAAWAPDADDTITLVYKSGIFYELSRSAN